MGDELRDRLIETFRVRYGWSDLSAGGKVDAVLPLIHAEIAEAEQRGAEKAAQAIEATDPVRDGSFDGSLDIQAEAVLLAREAVPTTGDDE